MLLIQLPIDLLSLLSAFIDGFGLCKLWMCGSRSLHHLMTHSVTHFNLVYGHTEDFGAAHRWSSFISRLPRLTTLCISTPAPHEYHIVEDVNISTIPSGIRRLELKFANAFVCLLNNDFHPKHPSKRAKTNSNTPNNLSFMKLDARFPQLEQLTWVNALDFRGRPLLLSPAFPPRLQALHFSRSTSVALSHLLRLPSSLTALTVTLLEQTGENAWPKVSKNAKKQPSNSSIFPDLSSLRIFDVNSRRAIKYLPQTLTRLELEFREAKRGRGDGDSDSEHSGEAVDLDADASGDNLSINLRERDVRRLPAQLLHLSLGLEEAKAALISSLPSCLLSLRIPAETLQNCKFEHLPRSLTVLEVCRDAVLKKSVEECARLPATLRRIPRGLNLLTATWHDLPPALEQVGTLSVPTTFGGRSSSGDISTLFGGQSTRGDDAEALESHASLLPPSLKSFKALNWQSSMFSALQCSTLTSLSLRSVHYDADTMRAMSVGCPLLRCLQLVGSERERCCIFNDQTFPMHHLEEFTALSNHSLTDFDMKSLWARKLRTLTLELQSPRNPQSPAALTTSTPGLISHSAIIEWFKTLPTTLESITFSLRPALLDPQLLHLLPPSLTLLDISKMGAVSPQHMSNLPRTLQSLHIEAALFDCFTSTHLLECLPKRLHTLILPQFVLQMPKKEKSKTAHHHEIPSHLLPAVPFMHALPLLRSTFQFSATTFQRDVGWDHGETRIPPNTNFLSLQDLASERDDWL